eukprot:TRINITY_DN1745_c0_g1_i3.p1 TRINITY_DN1745_c0_g1~~TRINITY_DN1745_c0_g1_i3.p1  ORF type:complete len:307 (+),score=46.44 TRINITY_DN1745_c0_g1_i3:91-921(+)
MKRRQFTVPVAVACKECSRTHLSCSHYRPCHRCKKKGIECEEVSPSSKRRKADPSRAKDALLGRSIGVSNPKSRAVRELRHEFIPSFQNHTPLLPVFKSPVPPPLPPNMSRSRVSLPSPLPKILLPNDPAAQLPEQTFTPTDSQKPLGEQASSSNPVKLDSANAFPVTPSATGLSTGSGAKASQTASLKKVGTFSLSFTFQSKVYPMQVQEGMDTSHLYFVIKNSLVLAGAISISDSLLIRIALGSDTYVVNPTRPHQCDLIGAFNPVASITCEVK